MGAPAQAQSIPSDFDAPRYTIAQLDTAWVEVWGTNFSGVLALPELRFTAFETPSDPLPPPDHGGDFPLPPTVGESASTAQPARPASERLVIATSDRATLLQRRAMADIYLSKLQFFAPTDDITAESLRALALREYIARSESFAINALFALEAVDPRVKCPLLVRLQDLGGDQGARFVLSFDRLRGLFAQLPPSVTALEAGRKALSERLRAHSASAACAFSVPEGRAETLAKLRLRIQSQIEAAVREKIRETQLLMRHEARDFARMANEMSVSIPSRLVDELLADVASTKAVLVLARDDRFGLKPALEALDEAKGFSDLLSTGNDAAVQEGAELREEFQRKIDQVLGKFGALSTQRQLVAQKEAGLAVAEKVVDDCAPLAVDGGLVKPAFGPLKPDATAIAAARGAVTGPFRACLQALLNYVDRLREQEERSKDIASFARQLNDLSKVYLWELKR
ncbi:hypothetical protein SAMN04488105_13011 [Salipiger thiooxidans]|uniref:Uncharacterized protein n=2 Tax=Salipiger thiooxidans TaxID=282683 RepID=A0A1G7M7M7_9RHOB|nr:hypothetical protein SAMN04488105_13011 [Salipiger thiooxidans]